MEKALHYFYDPLCGWCYAAEFLLDAAAGTGLAIELHGGGLFQGTTLEAGMRAHIRESDARIGQLSGQVFGAPYLDGLLADPQTWYDSTPPIAAILAVRQLQPAQVLPMLKAIQHAHYRSGLRVVDSAVLAGLAAGLGLEAAAFLREYEEGAGRQAEAHIAATRAFMGSAGLGGFPAFVLQDGGRYRLLRHDAYFGQPEQFATVLRQTLA